ncbi:heme ABC exporter ATP-binding protein CcmA [Formicincola oecophyllae]|uniref:Heme ABC exporter ATP-binding protein CcmA n=1 Tax=Formicincola oecophyllae TaxID=2558361 RepID=A0A4Y6UAX5_9PROT|nr:heme ABC exporter ATP-binding protein CcmA [Formicincola oecophyllae]QDH13728.1 heme ABC exporter ATP-binding protein CcmA [Formicincola oecophyllae]
MRGLLLEANHLTLGRLGRVLVRNINLAVRQGELVEVIGPNGVGKSTLLRVLAGLAQPMAGLVRRKDCVWVGHDNALVETQSVLENMRAVLPPSCQSLFLGKMACHQAMLQALDLWGLGRVLNAPAATLSAGQKRRLALARTTLAPEKLWLLDEPSSALDAAGETLFKQQLARHRAQGGAAVLATHGTPAGPGALRLELAAHQPGRL